MSVTKKVQVWNRKFRIISLLIINIGGIEQQAGIETDSSIYYVNEGLTLKELIHNYLVKYIDLDSAYLNAVGPHLKIPEVEQMQEFMANRILHNLREEDGQWRSTIGIYNNHTFLHVHADFLIIDNLPDGGEI